MTDSDSQQTQPDTVKRGFSGTQVTLIAFAVLALTVIATVFIVRSYIFPTELQPVTLSTKEELRLDQKLRLLGWQPEPAKQADANAGAVTPEPYSESAKDREVKLSEKELNALIGGNPDFAKRLAIGLSDDLASAIILVPVPEDFPVMPGQVLRVNAGLEVRLNESRQPIAILRGISVMGVPVPNAWLGNLKNVDLVGEFGDRGFWKAFADGVEDVQIREGELYIKLRE